MTQVSIEGNWIRVGDDRVALLAGEFHYFRHSPIYWGAILDTIKSGGIQVVSTYVCWDFHELAPGHYDFRGETDPQRDLNGFLQLCKEKGIYVLLRPGPYIFSEWRNMGVPDHAAAYHRLHPSFLMKARHYLEAVLPIAREHQVTEGGGVILVQVDNEVDMNQSIYTPTDGYPGFSAEYWRQVVTAGSSDEPGTFRHWLKARYGTVESLNEAWGAHYSDFAEALPTREPVVTVADRNHLFDGQQFWQSYSTAFLREMATIYREADLSVPLYTNVYSTPSPMNAAEMQEVVDLVGPDFYCSNPILPEELLGLSLGVRLARSMTRIPWSPEFQAGTVSMWVESRGTITPQHHRTMGLLGMVFGLKGWSWYMLVNRDEWYFAPINEKGEPREHYYRHFRDLIRVARAIDWPNSERCCDTGLIWYHPHYWFSQPAAAGLEHGAAGEFSRAMLSRTSHWSQVFSALHAGGTDFELWNPEGKYLSLSNLPLLIYAGYDFADSALVEQLLQYVSAGGTLVIFGIPPVRDTETGGPSALFDVVPPIAGAFDWGAEVMGRCGETDFVAPSSIVLNYDLSDHPEATPIEALATVAGYILPLGKGRLCGIGLDASPALLRFLHRFFNVSLAALPDREGVLVSAWRGEIGVTLVVVNPTPNDAVSELSLDLEALGLDRATEYGICDMLQAEDEQILSGQDLTHLSVSIVPRDGKVIQIRTIP